MSSVTHVDDTADSASLGRIWVMREIISRVWLTVGKMWDCGELVEMAEKVGCHHSQIVILSHLVQGAFIHASSVVPSIRDTNIRSTR
jgi:hypothetical protein